MSSEITFNAAAKLEPFLLMSKSAKGAAAAKLIQDAMAAPGVFVFSELLELPNIQELGKTEHAPYLALLRLFAYGTYEDYLKQANSLPKLNQAQTTKLKLLTLVSLALERRVLPYSVLLQSLHMPTIRELEDLIIDGIYLDLIGGKLDQKYQQLEVEYVLGRDVEEEKIAVLLNSLRDWASTTASVLAQLDTQLSNLASQKLANKTNLQLHEESLHSTVKEVSEKIKEGKNSRRNAGMASALGMSGVSGEDRMDVDDPMGFPGGADGSRAKKWKTSTSEHAKGSRKRNRF